MFYVFLKNANLHTKTITMQCMMEMEEMAVNTMVLQFQATLRKQQTHVLRNTFSLTICTDFVH